MRAKERVDLDLRRAQSLNLSSTPSVLINGKPVPFEQMTVDGMKQMIDAELAQTSISRRKQLSRFVAPANKSDEEKGIEKAPANAKIEIIMDELEAIENKTAWRHFQICLGGGRFRADRFGRFGLSDRSAFHRRKSSVQYNHRMRTGFDERIRGNLRHSDRRLRRNRIFSRFLFRASRRIRQSKNVASFRFANAFDVSFYDVARLSASLRHRSVLSILSACRL